MVPTLERATARHEAKPTPSDTKLAALVELHRGLVQRGKAEAPLGVEGIRGRQLLSERQGYSGFSGGPPTEVEMVVFLCVSQCSAGRSAGWLGPGRPGPRAVSDKEQKRVVLPVTKN